MSAFDYVVIGSGSAGAIIAARLSEDLDVSVLLVEAGPENRSPILHIPALARYAYNARKFNWNFETEPEPHLNGRRLAQPRGRVLGGSSSINGMLYLRGHALDYEGWTEAGASGWSYADILPYFRRLEGRAGGDEGYTGHNGPVRVSRPEPVNPIAAAFVEAGLQAGYPLTTDVNGYKQEGFGVVPMNARGGFRWSTARAYLKPARARSNLTIWAGCQAERIAIRGRKAESVRLVRRGKRIAVTARREIILSAGAIGSPHLLMLSGIGPADALRSQGIKVAQDLPGVGENLQDHALTSIQLECKQSVSLARHLGLFAKARAGMRWLLRRDGLLANNHFECGAFIRSEAGVRHPDIQLGLVPIGVAEGSKDFSRNHSFQVQVSQQRSNSRGWVRLRSADPTASPRFLTNMMSAPRDWVEMRAGIRLAREVLSQPAMEGYRGREHSPGLDVQSDAEIDAFLRETVQSSYHLSGTCKMGMDAMAVVDPQCRVHSIEGLRVIDSSIMPTIPSCNLNAPSMMIGERGADLIRGMKLPPSNLRWHVDEAWKTKQREGMPQSMV